MEGMKTKAVLELWDSPLATLSPTRTKHKERYWAKLANTLLKQEYVTMRGFMISTMTVTGMPSCGVCNRKMNFVVQGWI